MAEITTANEKNSSEWDAIVDSSKNSTLFHKWNWLKTAEKYTHSKLYPLMCLENGEVTGIFPIFLQKSFSIKSVFSPPPRTAMPYLGPLMCSKEGERNYDKESSFIGLCSEVVRFINSEIKPNYTRLAFAPGLHDTRPLMWAGYEVEPYYCYFMDVKGMSSDHVLSQLKKNLRNGINRSVRFGVKVREGGEKELDAIYKLMERRYEEQDKVVTVDKRYLNEIYHAFKKNIKIWVAEYKGEIITGIIDLHYNNRVSSWIGNPKPETKHVNANDLLNWTAIKWACDNGLDQYEQIGAAGVQRLYGFYSKFNFEILLCLTARKYSSPIFKLMENSYIHIIKPAKAKLKR